MKTRESQKEPTMNTRRSSFTRALSLAATLVALGSGAVMSSPAGAQASLSAATTTATSTSSTTTTTATSASVAVRGIVSGAAESVSFSGLAQLSTQVVTDPDFGNPPTVILSIDLGGVTGVGSSTGKKYVVSSKDVLNRRLSPGDTVQVNFPYYVSGGSPLSASVGAASFNLRFDTATLKLTGASGTIASPQ
jgi:hypothetical protein